MAIDLPLYLIAGTVVIYWACVGVMSLRSRLLLSSVSGIVPRVARERLLWSIWVPNIIAWIVLPVIAVFAHSSIVGVPALAAEVPELIIARCVGAIAGAVSLGLTIPCWVQMGKNWSIAVVPGKKTDLVTHGLFSISRNPIYTFNLLLMLSTALVLMNIPMLFVATIHATLIMIKVLGEEKHLLSVHGQAYVEYCRRTARFLPLKPARPATDASTSAFFLPDAID